MQSTATEEVGTDPAGPRTLSFPLETPRLLMRPWEPTDTDAFHRLYASPEVMRWVGGGPSRDIEHSERRLTWMIEQQARTGLSLWATIERESGAIIGECGLIHVGGEGPEVEIAYKLCRPYWGHGYASEAAQAVMEAGFRALGLRRIVAYVYPDNIASRCVLERIGMRAVEVRRAYSADLLLYELEGGTGSLA